jgi:hypothetical protein
MSTQVQLRRGTTAQHETFTGALAEVTVDTDKMSLVIHDGTTAGGHPVEFTGIIYDDEQSLSTEEKAQALANLGLDTFGFTLGGNMVFASDTRINFLPVGEVKSFALAAHNEGAFNIWGGDSTGADNPSEGATGSGITFYGRLHADYAEEIKIRALNQHPLWFKVQPDFATANPGLGTPTKDKGWWYMENFSLVGVDIFQCRGLSVNAPGTRMRIDDTDITLGALTAVDNYEINKSNNDGYLQIGGGTTQAHGFFLRWYGDDTGAASTDGGLIGYSNNTQVIRYRNDISQWDFLANTIKTTGKTVSALPSAATAGAGARAFVTDASATTLGSTVAGGGSNAVPVYSDGTNWKIG